MRRNRPSSWMVMLGASAAIAGCGGRVEGGSQPEGESGGAGTQGGATLGGVSAGSTGGTLPSGGDSGVGSVLPAPDQTCFDGGFSSQANVEDIKQLGVQDVAFSKHVGLEVTEGRWRSRPLMPHVFVASGSPQKSPFLDGN